MGDRQLLSIASTAVLAAQHFPRTTDEWEALAPALKTWPNWKVKYRAAHIARKRQLLASGSSEPLGRAHAVATDIRADTFDKLDGYLDNLANAATHEKSTLASLVEANATLTASNATLTTSYSALSAAYVILAAKAGGSNPTNGNADTRNNRRRNRGTDKPQVFAADGYCWTHGYKVGLKHTSATCNSKADGHKDGATRANTMNGSTANKGWN
jgi:hypothetical protein